MADGSADRCDSAKHRLSRRARESFAVVVPAYDEVESIGELIRAMRAAFTRHGLQGEVLLVDDGSRDGTVDAALHAAQGWSRLRVLQHPRNLGKTEALITASQATDAEWLVVLDADLQYDPDDIPRFLMLLDQGFDIVTGRKVGPYEKKSVSRIYNGLSRAVFGVPVSDLNSMKALRREIFDEIPLRHDWHRFLVVLAWKRGFSVTEIDVQLRPRLYGHSKYSGPLRVVLGTFDLVAVSCAVFFGERASLPRGRLTERGRLVERALVERERAKPHTWRARPRSSTAA